MKNNYKHNYLKKMYFETDDVDLGNDIGENIYEEIVEETDILNLEDDSMLKSSVKISLPVLTKYEKSVIISQRIKQLENNFKTTIPEVVKKEGLIKSYQIALKEYELRKLPPFIIKRRLGNGKYEEWKLEDFVHFS